MIPLAVLVAMTIRSYRAGEYEKLIDGARKNLEDYTAYSMGCVDMVYRIESLIAGNSGLIELFFFTDLTEPLPVILRTRAVSDELERLQVSLPLIYGIRIFIANRGIPERWPIFFYEGRLSLPPEKVWQYDFRTTLMGTLEAGEPLVAFSNEILFSKRQIGCLQILMRTRDFFPFLFREEDPENRNFVFFQGRALPGTPGQEELPPGLVKEILIAAAANPGGFFRFRDGAATRIFVWHAVPGTELLLVRDCSTRAVQKNIYLFIIVAALGIAASAVLLFFIIRFATQKMMTRLYIIMEGMKEVQKGNLELRLSVEGNDEITDMARIFTDMVGRIKALIAQTTEEQRLIGETELRAMQNQINSHFLYNALETIKMQAELASESSIVESITLLGRMLRYCLRSGPNRVSIREELEYIRSYIGFLNIRNDYRVTLKENLNPSCMDHQIPKMLIQPLVENAFHHAIEPEGEDAVIELRTEKKDGALWISVRDYGPGIKTTEPDIFAGGEKKKGIGLSNIQMRLSAFYGPQWKLRIENAPGGGTLVRIPIPEQAG
jgi:two-component system sensor histidine kinase YesM